MPDQGWEQQGGLYAPPGAYVAFADALLSITPGAAAWSAWAVLNASIPYPLYVVALWIGASGTGTSGKQAIGYGPAGAERTVAEVMYATQSTGADSSGWSTLPFPAGPIPAGSRVVMRVWGNSAASLANGAYGLRADMPLRPM